MRLSCAVHVEAMPVEAPEEVRVIFEELGVSALDEVELPAIRGVVIPETLIAAEVGEP